MPIPRQIAMAKGIGHSDWLLWSHMPTPGTMNNLEGEWSHTGNVGANIRKSEDKCFKINSVPLPKD